MDEMKSNTEVLEKNPALKNEIANFVRRQIELKKIELSDVEFSSAHQLIEASILQLEGEVLTIVNINLIAIVFFEYYQSIFEISISSEFEDTYIFLKNIECDFLSGGKPQKWRNFRLELFKITIWKANRNHKLNFNDFIIHHYLDNNTEFRVFCEAYNLVLKDLEISAEYSYKNAKKMMLSPVFHRDNVLNDSRIRYGIRNKCLIDSEYGLKIFQLVKDDVEFNGQLLTDIISALYSVQHSQFYKNELDRLIEKHDIFPFVLTGLSNVRNLNENDIYLFIEIINRYKEERQLDNSIIPLFFCLLNQDNGLSDEMIRFCFSELSSKADIKENAEHILHELFHVNQYKKEIGDLIECIANKDYFDLEQHLQLVINILWNTKDIYGFKRFLHGVANSNPFKSLLSDSREFSDFFDIIEFEDVIIDFLTDERATIRFIGLELFSKSIASKKFSLDILTLPYIKQFKLWIALTSDFKEPQYNMPALVPLLDSRSYTVKENFILKLENYVENYSDSLIPVLEACIDYSNLNHLEVLNRLKEYRRAFLQEYCDVKKNIKELNPYYTDNKSYRNFSNLFQKEMNRAVSESSKNHSLLGIFGPEIILAKGGGWTSGKDENIAKLNKFESSFTLPRSYFIDPMEYEKFEVRRTRYDWDKSFLSEIEKLIADE